jgi:hypothetical protein
MRLGLAFLVLMAAGCQRPATPAIAHQQVGEENRALRDAFNADVDKVRVLMILAPS